MTNLVARSLPNGEWVRVGGAVSVSNSPESLSVRIQSTPLLVSEWRSNKRLA